MTGASLVPSGVDPSVDSYGLEVSTIGDGCGLVGGV